MKVLGYRLTAALAFCCLLSAFFSCRKEPSTLSVLSEADSAMIHGDYSKADELLRKFRNSETGKDEETYMYYQLLRVGLQYKNGKAGNSPLLMDSLRSYYQHRSTRKYAQALFYTGYTYYCLYDYSTAIGYYLKAIAEAEKAKDTHVLSWIYRQAYDTYMNCGLYDEMPALAQKYYDYTKQDNDTVQMAYAANSLGLAWVYKNNPDSAIHYYLLSIKLGEACELAKSTLINSHDRLADIYLQLGEYGKAQSHMARDSSFCSCWAYWHLAQNNLDSAVFYFKKKYRLATHPFHRDILNRAEALRMLGNIERQRGRTEAALEYLTQYVAVDDTLKELTRERELKQIKARYDYTSMERQRDEANSRWEQTAWMLTTAVALLLAGIIAACWSWQLRRTRRKMQQTKERLLYLETEEHNGLQEERETKERMLMGSGIYHRVTEHAGEKDFALTASEWNDLERRINDAYNGFCLRLASLATLKENELRMCLLTKIGLKPMERARLLKCSPQAATMMRQRLFQKLTGHDGTANDFDELISKF